MREDKQSFVDDGEMTDAELDLVSGGNGKPVPKPKPKPPTNPSGGGILTFDGIKGESKDDNHTGQIE